jgi:hypothetical protein
MELLNMEKKDQSPLHPIFADIVKKFEKDYTAENQTIEASLLKEVLNQPQPKDGKIYE